MLYDVMFQRKSIRKYTGVPISNEKLDNITSYMDGLERLFPDIKTEFRILSAKEVTTTTSVKAPHYIAIFSEEKTGYLTNIGFMIEQLDLYLSDNRIGACWVGMGSPAKEITESTELKYVILLAFGNGEGEIHRKDVSEFNRKEGKQISNVDNELANIVRLAPSAMNSQPWYLNQNKNDIDIYISKNNIFKNLLIGDKNKIDVGIAICYLLQVVKHNNKEVEFKVLENREWKGHEYVITAIIK